MECYRFESEGKKEKHKYLLIYDIINNKKRLAVAKICEAYGKRIQKSAFEFEIDSRQVTVMKKSLKKLVTPEDDIRIYNLSNTNCEILGGGVEETLMADIYVM